MAEGLAPDLVSMCSSSNSRSTKFLSLLSRNPWSSYFFLEIKAAATIANAIMTHPRRIFVPRPTTASCVFVDSQIVTLSACAVEMESRDSAAVKNGLDREYMLLCGWLWLTWKFRKMGAEGECGKCQKLRVPARR